MAQVLTLGIVGLGRAAASTLPSLCAHPGISIVAAADPNSVARERFIRDFGGTAYEDAESMCARAPIDGVYIATPHQCHVDDALTAAAFGKHMIIEKPMALSLQDCDRIIEATRKANVTVLVGHTQGFNPGVRLMRQIIESGELGAVRMLTNIAYTDFLYRPRRPEELDTSLGGGIMFNQVPHQIEIARVLVQKPLRSVRAISGAWDPRRRTEGALSAFLEFEGNVAATLIYSGYDHFDTDEFHDWVTEGGARRVPSHGAAWRALQGQHRPEAQLRQETGFGGRGMAVRPPEGLHQPHFGVLLVSCERGDMRSYADGVVIYDGAGRREIRLPAGRSYPDRDLLADEFYKAVVAGVAPLQDAAWGRETVAMVLDLCRASAERREILVNRSMESGTVAGRQADGLPAVPESHGRP